MIVKLGLDDLSGRFELRGRRFQAHYVLLQLRDRGVPIQDTRTTNA